MAVTEILMEGFKFFRDKNLSVNAVKDFVDNTKELNALNKSDTFYDLDSIMKIWRYVLRAVIEYINLDPRFDCVRTHHFVLLNHFWNDRKVSFPFYLLTSMSKVVSNFKKKPTTNPALHEELLLLIYVHFKAQMISNIPSQARKEETESSSYSSDLGDIQSISSEEGGFTFTGIKAMPYEKKSPSPITPS